MKSFVSFDNMYDSMFKKNNEQKSVHFDVPQETLSTEDSFPTSFHSQLQKSLPSLKKKNGRIRIKTHD